MRFAPVVLLWLAPCSLRGAQDEPTSKEAEPRRRLAVTVNVGSFSGGGLSDASRALEAGGFTASLGNPLGGAPLTYPIEWPGGPVTASLSLGYPLRQPLEARLVIGHRVDFGEVWGYRGPFEPFSRSPNAFVHLSPTAQSVGVLLVLTKEGLRIGLGPSLNRLTLTASRAVEKVVKTTRVGFMLEVGVAFPSRSRLFVDLAAQYRRCGAIEGGPWEARDAGPQQVLVGIVPRHQMTLDHTVLTIGFGLRL